ncbi:MAG: DUF3786 domain-containing protein [Candidatus Electrothrix sp. YB6]
MTPHAFLKYIPASNCGKCGYAACLAFAVAVTKGGVTPELCPYLDREALPADFGTGKTAGFDAVDAVDRGQNERDMALVAHLKSKVQPLDFQKLAPRLGVDWLIDRPEELRFVYLGREVSLSSAEVVLNDQEPTDLRDQILLYNYVAFGGGSGNDTSNVPDDTWVGMESLPNSIAKIRTLSTYCEQRLAERFSGRAERLAEVCRMIGIAENSDAQTQSADIGLIIPVLPHVPLYLLFWDEDAEDGFEARVKILFDQHVLEFLDLESLVFAAERLADRLLELDS